MHAQSSAPGPPHTVVVRDVARGTPPYHVVDIGTEGRSDTYVELVCTVGRATNGGVELAGILR